MVREDVFLLIDSFGLKAGLEGNLSLKGRTAIGNQIEIGFEGYGVKTMDDGAGFPVYIELYEGKLRLMIWADINNEEPTHVIELNGAAESLRKPDVPTL